MFQRRCIPTHSFVNSQVPTLRLTLINPSCPSTPDTHLLSFTEPYHYNKPDSALDSEFGSVAHRVNPLDEKPLFQMSSINRIQRYRVRLGALVGRDNDFGSFPQDLRLVVFLLFFRLLRDWIIVCARVVIGSSRSLSTCVMKRGM